MGSAYGGVSADIPTANRVSHYLPHASNAESCDFTVTRCFATHVFRDFRAALTLGKDGAGDDDFRLYPINRGNAGEDGASRGGDIFRDVAHGDTTAIW